MSNQRRELGLALNNTTTSTPIKAYIGQEPAPAALQYQLHLTQLLMDDLREGVTIRDAVLPDASWMSQIFNVGCFLRIWPELERSC